MSEIAIRAENLGKSYQIDHAPKANYRTLRESLAALSGWGLGRRATSSRETIWALKNVSFEVQRGEALGIIGRNGAGKSTLLKILSRITSPTSGRAEIYGRLGSLLEVGTGFHPELTGRENIYLNGAILGMGRGEIRARFDEIVAFAETEQFLDTPVKRYSTGMYMRLAFAVAAHFESDILIVDEVLAVGDAAFQAKCLGRIADLGASGRTVIFVSHSMPSILRLCTRALLLDRGQRVTDGPTHEVIRTYLESELGKSSERRWASIEDAPGDRVAKLRSIRVLPGDGNSSDEIDIRQPIEIEVEFVSEAPGELRPSVNLHFYNDEGVCLFVSNDWNDRQSWARRRSAGVTRSTCRIPGNFLAEGRVVVTVAVSTYHPIVVHALERDAVAFQIVDRSQGDGVRGLYANEWPGVVRPMLDWQVEALPR